MCVCVCVYVKLLLVEMWLVTASHSLCLSVYVSVVLAGGSVGISSAPPTALALSQSWDSRDGVGEENGGSSIATRGGGALPENWELAFSDSGEPYYIE